MQNPAPTPSPPLLGFLSDNLLRKVQAGSGLAFSTFLSFHLSNALLAPLGPLAYDGVMAVGRIVYQHPLVEPLLIVGSLTLHVSSSALLLARRYRRSRTSSVALDTSEGKEEDSSISTTRVKVPLHLTLHRYTGYVLMAFVGAHALATRAPNLFLGGEPTDFAFIAYSLEVIGKPFFVYYVVFASSAAYHLSYGFFQALKVFFPRQTIQSKEAWIRRLFKVEKGNAFNVSMIGIAVGIIAAVAAFNQCFFTVDKVRYPEYNRFVDWTLSSFGISWKIHA